MQVNLSVESETAAELEKLLQDVSAPPDDNKYPAFLADYDLFCFNF